MDAASRLDSRFGTGTAFVSLLDHASKCARELNGLHATGIFFFLDYGKIYSQPFVTGKDEQSLAEILQKVKQSNTFGGHGTIFGASVASRDCVMMQFCVNPLQYILFKCDIQTGVIEIDDHMEP